LQAREYAIDSFRQVLKSTDQHSVEICFEPLARSLTNFITSVAQGVELCREIDHPCFRLHLDVLAMCDEGRPLDELVRSAKGYVAHVHANDVNGGYPGSGQTDLAPAIRALKEIGYDGWLSVEVFDFGPGPETIATQSHAYLRRLLDNP
jgi:sugar phosphate isomerase/epimerase